ncbi:hypothetical protein ONZ51_g10219 [Trametes cubensis]|uniref:Uncharacterized protein n=1 Tax=Trametes cubensis TaxID=1111947 RepID=A0AAD7TL36_9APHY|nr:hypothetical protein ONZ51_g10219 [Trametes cubensis]
MSKIQKAPIGEKEGTYLSGPIEAAVETRESAGADWFLDVIYEDEEEEDTDALAFGGKLTVDCGRASTPVCRPVAGADKMLSFKDAYGTPHRGTLFRALNMYLGSQRLRTLWEGDVTANLDVASSCNYSGQDPPQLSAWVAESTKSYSPKIVLSRADCIFSPV